MSSIERSKPILENEAKETLSRLATIGEKSEKPTIPTIEQVRALIKAQIRREELNFAALGGGGQTMNVGALEWVLKQLDALQKQTICEGLEEAAKNHRSTSNYHGDINLAMEDSFIRGAAWLAEQGVVEVGTMGDFGVALDKSVVSRMAETFKEGDRVVVQYRLLNK